VIGLTIPFWTTEVVCLIVNMFMYSGTDMELQIYTPEVEVVEELEESVRGAGGFGSTGIGA
jgi:hypothetical protein